MDKTSKVKVLKVASKKSDLVSEDDILHLFFALVKLIKKNAIYETTNMFNGKVVALQNRVKELESQLLEKSNVTK